MVSLLEFIAKSFPEPKVVIKAQVLTGGRGKAGGVKLANSLEEVEKISGDILGMKIKEFKSLEANFMFSGFLLKKAYI